MHQVPERFTAAFFVGIAPFLINSALCLLFCLPAVLPLFEFGVIDPIAYAFAWLGVSIGMHAFPSTQDLTNVWDLARPAARRGHPLAILGFPLVGLLLLANLGRYIWLDLFWGMAVGGGLPLALLRLCA